MKHTLCSLRKQVNGFFCCSANTSSYSHYVFSALDTEDSGVITFEVERLCSPFFHYWWKKAKDCVLAVFQFYTQEFALGLSVLLNGSLEEKLRYFKSEYPPPRIIYFIIITCIQISLVAKQLRPIIAS